jgi:hypothetical protein
LTGKYIIIISLLIGLHVSSSAQKISISADNQPLSEVLVQLRDDYGMAFSFDDAQLRKFLITLDNEFQNTEALMDFLLKDFPLAWEKTGEVFVIYPGIPEHPVKTANYLLRGRIIERKTMEFLPFASIAINGAGTVSDENGYFSHRSADSIFNVQVSYIGYYRADTTLYPDENNLISLIPSMEQLEEVVITDRVLETFLYSSDQAGVVHMNHKVSRFLPGSSNNSLFNLLSLQSGISAATESLENLIIWGSYEGQSRIIFDDMVLFGLENFNDNIGTVNPYVVKDIRLMKGAFGANYGDCVGGIAEIKGKDGNRRKFSMGSGLDNYAFNSVVETPVGKNSSLIMGFRHTYRNLYDNLTLDLAPNRQREFNSDVTLIPDYLFRDINLKYAYHSEQDFFIRLSMMAGQDNFSYMVDEMLTRWLQVEKNTSETSLQKGASMVIGKNGMNGLSGQFVLSYSALDSKYNDEQEVTSTFAVRPGRGTSTSSLNSTSEVTMKLETIWAVNASHQLEGAFGWTGNSSSWSEDSTGVNFIDQQISGGRITLMAQDRMTFGKFRLVPGIRVTHVPHIIEPFLEPRLSTSWQINEAWDFSVAAGIHRQYLTRNSVGDEFGNFRYMWMVANNTKYPILQSRHLAATLNLEKNNTQISVSSWHKKTNGLTRYINYRARDFKTLATGHSRSYGIDLYLKQNFLGHTTWASYTLSKTEESFEHFPDNMYLLAPHDQRHELKLAAMLNFDPIYFSASYIYGSGFAIPELTLTGITYSHIPYRRLDASLTYKFHITNFYGEAGISVLNLFNRENLLYNNLKRVPTNQTSDIRLYQQSVPFTPTLYLRVGF